MSDASQVDCRVPSPERRERRARLAPEERDRMGRASRAKAEVLFDVNTEVERCLRILEAAAARKALEIEHWPEAVLDTGASPLPEPRNLLCRRCLQKPVHSAPKGGWRDGNASGRER